MVDPKILIKSFQRYRFPDPFPVNGALSRAFMISVTTTFGGTTQAGTGQIKECFLLSVPANYSQDSLLALVESFRGVKQPVHALTWNRNPILVVGRIPILKMQFNLGVNFLQYANQVGGFENSAGTATAIELPDRKCTEELDRLIGVNTDQRMNTLVNDVSVG